MAFFINTGRSRVYLSRAGVVDDGVTDNQAAIQTVLDSAAGMPLEVVFDLPGTVLTNPLRYRSNTTIEQINGGVVKKRGYGFTTVGPGLPLLANKNWTPGGTAPVDSNIRIRGLRVDGNRRGGGSGGTTAHWAAKGKSTYAGAANNSDQIVPDVAAYGVAGLLIEDIAIHDGVSFNIHLSNVNEFRILHVRKTRDPADTLFFDNGVQAEGYVTYGTIEDVQGDCHDDLTALNFDDEARYPAGVGTRYYPEVTQGPGSDITVRNIKVRSGGTYASAMRLLVATTTVSNILVDDVSLGTVVPTGVLIDNFSQGSGGTVNNLIIRNIRGPVPTNGYVCWTAPGVNFGRVLIDGLAGDGGGTRSPIQIPTMANGVLPGGGNIADLLVNNISCSNVPYLVDVRAGSITKLSRGVYCAGGTFTADINDPGSRIAAGGITRF